MDRKSKKIKAGNGGSKMVRKKTKEWKEEIKVKSKKSESEKE